MADDQGAYDEPRGRVPGRRDPPTSDNPKTEPDSVGREIGVDITPRQLRVTPGQSETAIVSIRYHGTRVAELALSLEGDAASWTRIAPDVVNVFPDTETETTLRFDPPRASSPAAGLVELILSVATSNNPATPTLIKRSVEVAAFDELVASAGGATSVADAREAHVPVKVRNGGNRAANVALRVSEPGSLDVQVPASPLLVEPGAETTVWVTVRPKAALPAGQSRIHPFTIHVSSDRSPPVAIDGRFEQLPLPPAPPPSPVPVASPGPRSAFPPAAQKKPRGRVLPAFAVLALLVAAGAAAVVGLGLWPPKNTPTPKGPTPTTATATPTRSSDGSGGADITGQWSFGEIAGTARNNVPGHLVLGELTVSSAGAANWGVQLFSNPFYDLNCSGSYDADSAQMTASEPALTADTPIDNITRQLSIEVCGFDLEAKAPTEPFSVVVANGFPRGLTMTSPGGTELSWKSTGR